MRDDVTQADVMVALRRLCTGLGRPFGAKIEAMADEYLGSLNRHGIPRVALEPAVSAALDRESGRFPSPGQLVMLARPFIPKSDGERQGEESPGSCPNCRTKLYHAGFRFPNGVVVPRLRCQCKPPAYALESWDHPDARAWREPDTVDLASVKAALRAGHWGAVIERGDAYEEPTRPVGP